LYIFSSAEYRPEKYKNMILVFLNHFIKTTLPQIIDTLCNIKVDKKAITDESIIHITNPFKFLVSYPTNSNNFSDTTNE
jgi:hypothetical protein